MKFLLLFKPYLKNVMMNNQSLLEKWWHLNYSFKQRSLQWLRRKL